MTTKRSIPHRDLWHGKSCTVPNDVAVCPECGGGLYVYCQAWDEETGKPVDYALQIDCENEIDVCDEIEGGPEVRHRWWQSDWQPVITRVWNWAVSKGDSQ